MRIKNIITKSFALICAVMASCTQSNGNEVTTYKIDMRTHKLIALLFLAVSLCGCGSNNTNNNEVITVRLSDDPEWSDMTALVESKRIVQLQTGDSLFLSTISDVHISGDRIYILDGTYQQEGVYMYNSDGTFIKRYKKKGHAANEYTYLCDWACDGENIYLLDAQKILVLDKDLNHIRNINLRELVTAEDFFGGDRIEFHGDELLVYENSNSKVFSFSKSGDKFNGEVLAGTRKNMGNAGIRSDEDIFYPVDEKTMFIIPSRSDEIYMLKDGIAKLFAQIDYKGKEEIYKKIENSEHEVINVFPKTTLDMFMVGDEAYFRLLGQFYKINLKDGSNNDFTNWKEDAPENPSFDFAKCKNWYKFIERIPDELNNEKGSVVDGIRLRNELGCEGECLQYLMIYDLK